MKPIGVFYATREGQTQRIAKHIEANLNARGLQVDLRDIRQSGTDPALTNYSAVLLAASVHVGKHEPEMVRFVKDHASKLHLVPSAFISVNLSEAAVERGSLSQEDRANYAAAVEDTIERFFESTHWHPEFVKPLAGALTHTRYNPIKRFIMTKIAKKMGIETDSTRDYEYTDWTALDNFVAAFVGPATRAGSTLQN